MSINQDNRIGWVLLPAIILCCLTPLPVLFRFHTRLRKKCELGWDDWVILGSLIFCMAMNGVLIASTHLGYGKHGMYLSHSGKEKALELFVISQMFYKVTINSTKASIVLLYLRLFPSDRFKLFCRLLLYLIGTYGIATTLTTILQCGSHVTKAWDKTVSNGTCIDTTAFWYANAGFNILGDLIILILPMKTIWNLQLRMGPKIGLVVIFALGFFVTAMSICRMTALKTTSKSPDPTFDVFATTWTIIEANVAIICACLPMCRPLLSFLFPKIFPRSGDSADSEAERQRRNKKHTPKLPNSNRFNSRSPYQITSQGSESSGSPSGPQDEHDVQVPRSPYFPNNSVYGYNVQETRSPRIPPGSIKKSDIPRRRTTRRKPSKSDASSDFHEDEQIDDTTAETLNSSDEAQRNIFQRMSTSGIRNSIIEPARNAAIKMTTLNKSDRKSFMETANEEATISETHLTRPEDAHFARSQGSLDVESTHEQATEYRQGAIMPAGFV